MFAGYGHLAPKTAWGRFLTIIYALIGIPLTFLYLSNVGNFLADSFRLFYKHICCDICWCRRCERKKKRERLRMRKQMELAAQRNVVLGVTSLDDVRFTIDGEVSVNEDTAGESGYIDDPEASVGLLGPGNLGSQCPSQSTFVESTSGVRGLTPDPESNADDVACSMSPEPNGTDSGIGEKAILDDASDPLLNTQIDYGALRETDILDSIDDIDKETDALTGKCRENDVISAKRHDSCTTDLCFLEQLRDAKETDILEDSDDDLLEFHSPLESASRDDGNRSQADRVPPPQNTPKTSPATADDGKGKTAKASTKKSKKDKKDKTKASKKGKASSGDSASPQKQNESKNEHKEATNTDKKTDVSVSGVTSNQTTPTTIVLTESEQIRKPSIDRRKSSESEPMLRQKQSLKIKSPAGGGSKKFARNNTIKLPPHRKCSTLRRQREASLSSDETRRSDESFVTAQTDPDSSSYQTLGVSVHSFPLDDVTGTMTSPPPPAKLLTSCRNASVVTVQPEVVSRSSRCSYDVTSAKMATMALADDAFDLDIDESEEKVTVPICVCLLIIATYIVAGSILFTLWEDWDPLTGSYFCFITLSTIGFGDIVPGTDMDEWSSQEKLVLCSLWLAFGLSLLAMCFNLMQEEVKGKCKWIGKKVGLLTNDNDG